MMNEKRSDELTDVEKDALRKLYEANRAPVPKTFNSTCALARALTDNQLLQPKDDAAQMYNSLYRRGWIVVRYHNSQAAMRLYAVSDDYLALQLT
ncbi:MAG: hypothetical protein JWO55_753 [Candidatus Saccharibacteria bacterium]|jgi:hypothetical protein|nr:hypothetical protein [Candidatus Saccharibacteria bacterium]